MYIASAKSQSTRRASHQPVLTDGYWTIINTHFCPVFLVDDLVQGVLQPILIGLNGGSGVLLSMVSFYSYGELVLFQEMVMKSKDKNMS